MFNIAVRSPSGTNVVVVPQYDAIARTGGQNTAENIILRDAPVVQQKATLEFSAGGADQPAFFGVLMYSYLPPAPPSPPPPPPSPPAPPPTRVRCCCAFTLGTDVRANSASGSPARARRPLAPALLPGVLFRSNRTNQIYLVVNSQYQ